MTLPIARSRATAIDAVRDRLSQALGTAVQGLGCHPAHDVRDAPVTTDAWITVFSGESGQGKTWSLCRSALARFASGAPVLLLSAPARPGELEAALRAPFPSRAGDAPESFAARCDRMRPRGRGRAKRWLTIYLDDVEDRRIVDWLAGTDWRALGVEVVVSALPRAAEAIALAIPGAAIVPITNFTSHELRRFLTRHGRGDVLELMPDDMFELLSRPLHARLFVELEPRGAWAGVTEYELFERHWRSATADPDDRAGLLALAGGVIEGTHDYPWPLALAGAAGLDDTARSRLEAAGLVRRPTPDHIAFASDRMLNWAVAERLAARAIDEDWTAERINADIERLDTVTAPGQRLGYVRMDMLWLLLRNDRAVMAADVICHEVRRQPQEWRGETMWRDHLGTLGARLLPALECLATRSWDEESEGDIPFHLPLAIVAAAETDTSASAEMLGRLLSHPADPVRTIALRAAREVALPGHIEILWALHLERERALADHIALKSETDHVGRLIRRQELSRAAIRPTIAAVTGWLEQRIVQTADPFALNLLLWFVMDRSAIDAARARRIWEDHHDHFLDRLAANSKALIAALGHFDDVDNRGRLGAIALTREDMINNRVLRARARIDPDAAFEQVRARHEEYGWSAANWWLPELARTDPGRLSAVIRDNAGKGEHPLTDLVLHYQHFPDLIDQPTLDAILDLCLADLRGFNAAADIDPDRGPGRFGHVLRFLPTLVLPWQVDCLARRAGTPLEDELVRFAVRRTGRTSRLRDDVGAQLEHVLAMIGGEGYDRLVVAALGRPDAFAREDGVVAAYWSDAPAVTAALAEAQMGPDPDTYRDVTRMQALAVHRLDAELEAMVRGGSLISTNAAHMRAATGRGMAPLRRRRDALLAAGGSANLRTAAELTGFMRFSRDARPLVPAFLDPATGAEIRHSIVATFKALGFYTPELLPVARTLLPGRIDEHTQFLAAWLGEYGDAAARAVVTEWLAAHDLGMWSASQHGFLKPLLDHGDSRHAVLDFLRRSREAGHVFTDANDLLLLAEDGDVLARERLARSAFRRSPPFGAGPVAGIHFLRNTQPSEAFFAARRLFLRERRPAAIDLMLEIDRGLATDLLIADYRAAPPSLREEIARRLRRHVPRATLARLLERLTDASEGDPLIAIEIAGMMPPSLQLAWLDDFADHKDQVFREAARAALSKREREAAAITHLAAMAASSKPQRWVRMKIIVECVDPAFLFDRKTPASLGRFLEGSPAEFAMEARSLAERRRKALEKDAKSADRDAARG